MRVMPDKSLVFPKRGQPPPDINGYERDPRDKWRFIPLWPPCGLRQKIEIRKPCGAYQLVMKCENSECPLFKLSVRVNQCNECQFRK